MDGNREHRLRRLRRECSPAPRSPARRPRSVPSARRLSLCIFRRYLMPKRQRLGGGSKASSTYERALEEADATYELRYFPLNAKGLGPSLVLQHKRPQVERQSRPSILD